MGDQDFSQSMIEYFIRHIDANELISINPIAVQKFHAKKLYDTIESKNAKGGIMKGSRESRFDEIIDVINDARLSGFLPIELCTYEDNEQPPFWFEIMNNEKIILQQSDFVVTIRFRK